MAQFIPGIYNKIIIKIIGYFLGVTVCEYEDVFSDELPGLPLHRDVDFVIELHPGISPISMTLHRMAPFKLQELKVQL